MMKVKRSHLFLVVVVMCTCAIMFRAHSRSPLAATLQRLRGKKTIANRVAQFADPVRTRLTPAFDRIGVAYPPQHLTLVGLKAERKLEVWVSDATGDWRHLKDYPVLGMSGTLGPKLKEGDKQVPEGIYHVESLNPNSLYHLALRLDYPNQEDRQRGEADGRSALGSDIMIHGKKCSIGCLAIGDEAVEDLFVLAATTGISNIVVVFSPVDFRLRSLPPDMPVVPQWANELYRTIEEELLNFNKHYYAVDRESGLKNSKITTSNTSEKSSP